MSAMQTERDNDKKLIDSSDVHSFSISPKEHCVETSKLHHENTHYKGYCIEFLGVMHDYINASCGTEEMIERVHSLLGKDDHLSEVMIPVLRGMEQKWREESGTMGHLGLEHGTLGHVGHNGQVNDSASHVAHSDGTFTCKEERESLPSKNKSKSEQEYVWMELQMEVEHSLNDLEMDFNLPKQCAPSASSVSCLGGYSDSEFTSDSIRRPSKRSRDDSSCERHVTCPFRFFDGPRERLIWNMRPKVDGSPNRTEPTKPCLSPTVRTIPRFESTFSSEHKDDKYSLWGADADDAHAHDLLSCIDHSILCDRENRFGLDWNVCDSHSGEREIKRVPLSDSIKGTLLMSSKSHLYGTTAGTAPSASPTSPSHGLFTNMEHSCVDQSTNGTIEDTRNNWDSDDFGTSQNRRVSHILSSCLHKRRFHHPYKNQIKLVNFHVPNSRLKAAAAHHGTLSGSVATSLVFGSQDHELGDGTLGNIVPMLTGIGVGGNGAASFAKGEKKPKRREERKRIMSQKMQETLAELETTFTEQDLDVKGLGVLNNRLGGISKMTLSKLETLPLPELSNLPHELKELKRKIEATELKVEGTKHRHRKGGPCPRCQVQNQLRAAKRAYHKRAVAHKKLPQIVTTMEALRQPPVVNAGHVPNPNVNGTLTCTNTPNPKLEDNQFAIANGTSHKGKVTETRTETSVKTELEIGVQKETSAPKPSRSLSFGSPNFPDGTTSGDVATVNGDVGTLNGTLGTSYVPQSHSMLKAIQERMKIAEATKLVVSVTTDKVSPQPSCQRVNSIAKKNSHFCRVSSPVPGNRSHSSPSSPTQVQHLTVT